MRNAAAGGALAPGQQILDRSSNDRDVVFVVSASVRAVDFSPSGREVVYAVIAAGGHFGELSAIDGMERSTCPAVQHTCAPRDLTAGRTRRRASAGSAAM